MYPYRFKTREEMIDTLGKDWRNDAFGDIGWNDDGDMEYLLGKDFPFTEEQLNFNSDEPINNTYERWIIHWDMLIKNKKLIPSYEPKKIDRTINESFQESYFDNNNDINKLDNYLLPDISIGDTVIFKRNADILANKEKEAFFSFVSSQEDFYKENIGKKLTVIKKYYPIHLKIFNNINNITHWWSAFETEYGDSLYFPDFCLSKYQPSYKPKKIDRTLESNISNKYYNPITKQFTKWPYRIKSKEEFDKDYEYRAGEWMTPEYIFISNMNYLLGQTLEYDFPSDYSYIMISRKDDSGSWYITKDMITKNNKGKPSYQPKKIDRVLESFNLLLEKSSLTQLGVPREVMQPIQRDFAVPSDAEWDRIKLKRDVQNILRKGNKDMILQITVDSIKVFVSYPRGSEIIYFIDTYIYNDTGWGGEFEKLEREYTTMTQLFYQIDSSTLLYHLKSDFSLIKQSKRKLIKKEKRFQDFTEKFKKDFLTNFDSILKRIVGTKYMDAKKDIDDKAKQIEIENQMMISGLSEPLSGPNSLSILDEFLMSFEDAYSEYFGERLDIEELSSYFSRDKIMTAFMYYIYTGKLLDK